MAQPIQIVALAKAILRSLPGRVSPLVLQALEGDHNQMLEISVNPLDYTDAASFGVDYFAYNLLRKWDGWRLSVDPAQEAIKSFLASEDSCAMLNKHGFRTSQWEGRALGTRREAMIHIARRKISSLLGEFDWNEAHRFFGFSGGASTRLPRRFGDPSFKFEGKPEVTRSCALLAVCDIWSSPLWREHMSQQYGLDPCNWVTIVDGARFDHVPKDAKTDRGINIEPDMNMRIQRGIGALIRQKLKKVGINLNSQDLNAELAREGSLTGDLATIDLKAASDSISCYLVRELLPPDWVKAMELCRSERVLMKDGTWHTLEKWSSMGNGYTFELESLIFWALGKSVQTVYPSEDKRLAVYGDDIVIQSNLAEPLIGLLDYCGFKTNVQKTFYYGGFRESCGKHYFCGVDVTPFNIKEWNNTTMDGCHLANSYRSWGTRFPVYFSNDVYNYLIWKTADLVGPAPALIPDGYGTKAGIISSWDVARPWTTSNRCSRPLCYVFSVLRFIPSEEEQPEVGRYLAALDSKNAPVEVINPYERSLVSRGKMRRIDGVLDPAWSDPPSLEGCFVTPRTRRKLFDG